ncbi:hypothetical protein GCM10010532_113780 [Dactylosporangium siamense]|uniref:Knr4/Smi1-like domain-containing protein n=1 Tax=Dactylosporangium siamense TaxID=685454 RepID=A0A919PSM6_9ACTN|nr:hypothetical protein Dsi01nite_079170 [Dactylosporangium siamense]
MGDVAGLREAWGAVERWLAVHAPRTREAVARPGGEAAVAEVEAAVGAALPEDVAEWYRLAGGVRFEVFHLAGQLIPPWYDPYPVDEAVDMWRMRQEVLADFVPAEDQEQLEGFLRDISALPAGTPGPEHDLPVWIPAWWPFAGDGGGGGLLIDLRAGPGRGSVLSFDRESNPRGPLWPSLTALWSDVAHRLPTPNGAVPDPVAEVWNPSSE